MIDAALKNLDPVAVAAYLQASGWDLLGRGQFGSRWRLTQRDGSRNVAIPTPNLDADDRAVMFAAALRVLEEVEDSAHHEVVRRLSDAGRDVVRFRLIAPELHDGEMPLAAAPLLLAGSRDVLTYAARAEFRPRPFYTSGSTLPSDVNNFVGAARVGATEHGSVILTVTSEIDDATPAGQQRFLAEEDRTAADTPFERRALRRLLQAVGAAKIAAHRDLTDADLDTIFDPDMEEGLSANLCDALSDLSGEKLDLDADIEIEVRWSLTVPTSEPTSVAKISSGEVKALAAVADALREIAPLPDRTAYGSVKVVSHVPEAVVGWADMLAEVDDRTLTVRVQLSDDEIEIAKRALSANRTHDLRVEGTLEKRGQRWEISSPESVTMVASTRRHPD